MGQKSANKAVPTVKRAAFSMVLGILFIIVWVGVANSQLRSKKMLEKDYHSNSYRAAPRDAFPVLTNPPMGTVHEGDRILEPGEWVIGMAIGGEAKAYPVDVMGFHELINDMVGGMPITVCW